MAKTTDKKKGPKDDAAGKKGKKGKKGKGGGGSGESVLSVAAHPRARAQVRQAKGWGGLGAFALALLLSLKASVPIVDAGERALIAGMAGYLLGWACSVTVWRHLMLAELQVAADRLAQRSGAAGDAD